MTDAMTSINDKHDELEEAFDSSADLAEYFDFDRPRFPNRGAWRLGPDFNRLGKKKDEVEGWPRPSTSARRK